MGRSNEMYRKIYRKIKISLDNDYISMLIYFGERL